MPFTDQELITMAVALENTAALKMREAKSRQWTGAQFAQVRKGLRLAGAERRELAGRVRAYVAARQRGAI